MEVRSPDMRNEDLNIIKWQLKLMSLLPSGPNARGRSVDDLCKELRRIETGDPGPDKARDDPFGKALIRRIQKALTALAQDEQWGSEIECQIAGSSGTLEKIHPDDGGTAKKFWKWKGKTRRLMVPPPGADEGHYRQHNGQGDHSGFPVAGTAGERDLWLSGRNWQGLANRAVVSLLAPDIVEAILEG